MAKRTGLTATFIDALKAGPGMVTYPDTTQGLELYVTKGGAKTWSFRYTLSDGTRRRTNLGRWPGKTITSARTEARSLMNRVADGGDPAQERKREREASRTRPVKTLDDLTAVLFTALRSAGVRASTLAYWGWLNKKHLAPRLGTYRLGDLSPGVTRRALREIGEAAGATTGNRAFALLRRAFNFGLDEEHVATSPMARMKRPFEEGSRARVLSDAEIKALWGAAVATKIPVPKSSVPQGTGKPVSRTMAVAVQLCLVTAQRRGEVAGMRAGELDLSARTWILPRARTKAKREHVVPLTALAIELIEEASAAAALRLGRAPKADDPIFPTPRLGRSARGATGELEASPPTVAPLSVGAAMSRLCELAGVTGATAHDLRRTASTVMASERIGVLTEVVSRLLNHAPPSLGVTAIYNRHAYLPEKRHALEAWSALLLELVGERERPSNVQPMRQGIA